MTTASPTYGTATTVTFTLASLATSAVDAGQESNAIDVTTIDTIDMWVGGKITVGTTPTANTKIEIWFAASYDGTTYVGGMTGADSARTPSAKELMVLAQVIPVKAATSNVAFTWGVSAASIFGGALPPKFNVFVTHNTAVNLNSTGGNHELKYRALNYESA